MRRIAGCILGAAIVGALACSDGPDITDPCEGVGVGCGVQQIDGAALFSETCSGCHTLELPISASISMHDEAWALIREMNDNGVSLSEAEEAAIVGYLCTLKGCADGR
ncbi:MAG: cytochrome c [Gemmatimonadota bacterium]|nr:cytochrome c [Gemmatimonadota bacterium]MDH3369302.1 cytochrome c [Gemmatimonadota bacterium]MDH3477814.1 cytochrome c [Gemmatimonadota bacterium]MDH3570577.1 cytochrome c [Gemmatimonadota bacterium]MDH5551657.1 cytochrome c [Gemmatimonadota bacterium]